MTSQIDPTVPVFGSPTTASVRNNFLIAKNEITALQNAIGITLPIPITSGGTGADDLLDAQINLQMLPLTGGTVTGQILLTATPSSNQSAVPKSYVDGNFPVTIANGGTGATSATQALINLGGVGLNSPAFTGTPTAPTVPASDNSANLATTAYVKSVVATLPVGITAVTGGTGITVSGTGAVSVALTTPVSILNGGTGATNPVTALANLGGAPIANPSFTGTPTAPTAPLATNTTQLATTAFVEASIAAAVAGVASITAGVGIVVTPVSGVGNVTVSLGTPVTIANGGTGAITGSTAFDSLLGGISSGSGFITRQPGGSYALTPATLTPANRPLIINNSNAIATSALTTDNGTTFAVNGQLSVGSPSSTSGQLLLYDRTTVGLDWSMYPAGGTLFWSNSVAGNNVMSLSTSGFLTTLGTNSGLQLTDRSSGQNWAIYSSGNVLTFSESVGGVEMNIFNGQMFVPGSVVIGSANQSTSLPLNVNSNGTAGQFSAVSGSGLNIRVDNAIPLMYFLFQSGTNVGTITTNGTNTAYNTSSDGRLKENDEPINPGFTDYVINSLRPVEFNWKAGEKLHDYGFIAQEVYEVFPNAVSPGEGEPGAEGFRPWAMDASKLIPLLVAEAQVARTRHAELVAELEKIKEAMAAPAPEAAKTPTPTPTPTPTSRRR